MAKVPATQRYGAALVFQVDTRGLNQIRDMRGRWISAQSRMIAVNGSMARRAQETLVEYEKSAVVRPKSSTGRLLDAYRDTENTAYDKFGWFVGLEDHLDASKAPYWRQIEYGSQILKSWIGPMVDKQGLGLYGYWSTNIIGTKSSGHPKLGKPFTRYGRGSGQNLAVLPRQIREDIAARGIRAPFRAKHIKPHGSYAKTWKAMKDPAVRQMQEILIDSVIRSAAR